MDLVDGKVICPGAGQVRRGRAAPGWTRPSTAATRSCWRTTSELAADHLEVIAGDKGEANLGLDQQTWQRLADTVDLIVDPAALVNHVLPYSELFGPNALGTAELIRIALTTQAQAVHLRVDDRRGRPDRAVGSSPRTPTSGSISATRSIDDSYANGYGNSKWAGEVLLREAHDLCGLPVAVFRCDMILADTTYAGQLNVPDMFTRMMLSLVATGIAPGSFYELDADGNRQRAHYDGLPVEFIAEAISTLGAQGRATGFQTYHVMNPYDDGIGLDEYVDWLIEAGYPIQRIGDYGDWLQRFETALRALPERQRQHSSAAAAAQLPDSPQSRSAGRWRRPTDSVPRCRKRKSARTKTFRTSRRRSSSSTSPTCSCSDCSDVARADASPDAGVSAFACSAVSALVRVGARRRCAGGASRCGCKSPAAAGETARATLPPVVVRPVHRCDGYTASDCRGLAGRQPAFAGQVAHRAPAARRARQGDPAHEDDQRTQTGEIRDLEHGPLAFGGGNRIADGPDAQQRSDLAADHEPCPGEHREPAAEHRADAIPGHDQQQTAHHGGDSRAAPRASPGPMLHAQSWSGVYAKLKWGPTNGINAPQAPRMTRSNPLTAPRRARHAAARSGGRTRASNS